MKTTTKQKANLIAAFAEALFEWDAMRGCDLVFEARPTLGECNVGPYVRFVPVDGVCEREDDSPSSVFEDFPLAGTLCSVCREPQRGTPSGDSCVNGHGGAPPFEEDA